MVKIRRNITVDEDIWEDAKIKISEPLSCFIQRQLELACGLSNERSEIENKVYEKEKELRVLRSRLIQIEKEEAIRERANRNLDECIPAITRIHSKCDVIGENQIGYIARSFKVKEVDLVEYCRIKGFNVVKFFDFDKDAGDFNGGGLR